MFSSARARMGLRSAASLYHGSSWGRGGGLGLLLPANSPNPSVNIHWKDGGRGQRSKNKWTFRCVLQVKTDSLEQPWSSRPVISEPVRSLGQGLFCTGSTPPAVLSLNAKPFGMRDVNSLGLNLKASWEDSLTNFISIKMHFLSFSWHDFPLQPWQRCPG